MARFTSAPAQAGGEGSSSTLTDPIIILSAEPDIVVYDYPSTALSKYGNSFNISASSGDAYPRDTTVGSTMYVYLNQSGPGYNAGDLLFSFPVVSENSGMTLSVDGNSDTISYMQSTLGLFQYMQDWEDVHVFIGLKKPQITITTDMLRTTFG